MDRLTCAEAKAIDMVDYLYSLGIGPSKVSGNDYWYLSPLRDERTPSFKVNRTKNLWYDHGLGKGGDFLQFGVLYHKCSMRQLLVRLEKEKSANVSFHQPLSDLVKSKDKGEHKLQVLSASPLVSGSLIHYAKERSISARLAQKYLYEVRFRIGEKNYEALGFKNREGGYELRSKSFKGSSSPKDVKLIENGGNTIAVFEGFFSFLSFLQLKKNGEKNFLEREEIMLENDSSFLILNSLSFLEKSIKILENYGSKFLYLDRDNAGKLATAKLLQHSLNCEDKSSLYQGHKDLNDYITHQTKWRHTQDQALPQKQSLRRGRHL